MKKRQLRPKVGDRVAHVYCPKKILGAIEKIAPNGKTKISNHKRWIPLKNLIAPDYKL